MSDHPQQAELLERYILALRANPNALAPADLDAEMADFARTFVINQPSPLASSTVKARVWQQALERNQSMTTSTSTLTLPLPHRIQRWLLPTLAAIFIAVILGMFLLRPETVQTTPLAASPTNNPTLNPMLTLTPAPVPRQTLDLDRITFESQLWDNSAAATLSMAINYLMPTDNFFTSPYDQTTVGSYLRPNREDKNVNGWEIGNYVYTLPEFTMEAPYEFGEGDTIGYRLATVERIGGTIGLLKRAIDEDITVLVQAGSSTELNAEWVGTYLLVVGYDEARQVLIVHDPSLGYPDGSQREIPYTKFEQHWWQFNNRYIVVYRNFDANKVNDVLIEMGSATFAEQWALEQARHATEANPADVWAWLNLNESLVLSGDYAGAVTAFETAQTLTFPARVLWYRFAPLEAYIENGNYAEAQVLATRMDDSAEGYIEEAWYYMGVIAVKHADKTEAQSQFAKVIAFNPNFARLNQWVGYTPTTLPIPTIDTNTITVAECSASYPIADAPNNVAPISPNFIEALHYNSLGVNYETFGTVDVAAIHYGTVVYAGWNSEGYGLTVILAHQYNEEIIFSVYAYLSNITTECGNIVGQGGIIGQTGNTGAENAGFNALLHFEIRDANFIPLNIHDYIDLP